MYFVDIIFYGVAKSVILKCGNFTYYFHHSAALIVALCVYNPMYVLKNCNMYQYEYTHQNSHFNKGM